MELEFNRIHLPQGVAPFTYITRNERSGRKQIQIKQKEEDIAVCECKFDFGNTQLSCRERCLNVLTNTECTPGYCPCGSYCKNQRFQKCEYAKTKLFKTEGRGWGLLADENIKAGRFIIEYCGEVISSDEAEQRSRTYEAQGLRDAYIISLNSNSFIDATKKGSLGRFINHSCQPNCETRKWTVLGETRVGIFATKDISVGTELAYDYNFEWYGGVNVRCLCGAPNCSIFLGAKSQGFQEHNHVWEDGDDRYKVDEFPLYDSAEDEPLDKVNKITDTTMQKTALDKVNKITDTTMQEAPVDNANKITDTTMQEAPVDNANKITDTTMQEAPVDNVNKITDTTMQEASITVKTETASVNNGIGNNDKASFSESAGGATVGNKCEVEEKKIGGGQHAMVVSGPSAIGEFNNGTGTASAKQGAKRNLNRKQKLSGKKQVNGKRVAQLFASKKVQDELIQREEERNRATLELDSVYDEIRPAIEERERDSLDSLPTNVAEKWIEASCSKLKSDFGLYFAVVNNVMCPPPVTNEPNPGPENAIDCLKSQ